MGVARGTPHSQRLLRFRFRTSRSPQWQSKLGYAYTDARVTSNMPAETAAPDTARRPVRIWIAAAVGAVALHGGAAALAIATLRPDDAPDELGANARRRWR